MKENLAKSLFCMLVVMVGIFVAGILLGKMFSLFHILLRGAVTVVLVFAFLNITGLKKKH